jgi:Ca2+-binding RTX toxin-like protein
MQGAAVLSLAHTYTRNGTYTIAVTATDRAGTASAVVKRPIAIAAVGLQADPSDASKTALIIGGTTAADTILISPADAKGNIRVTINGVSQGIFHPTGHIIAYGQAGNDFIQVRTARIAGKQVPVKVPALLFGDAGNDRLDTSGSSANNVLVGGAGNDQLTGGTGRDLLLGGLGADVLHGAGGDDILIGGVTDSDANPTALCALMAEWGRTNVDYLTRIAHLSTVVPGGRNGSAVLSASSVRDEAAIDALFGEAGQDWYFGSTRGRFADKVNGRTKGEVTVTLAAKN